MEGPRYPGSLVAAHAKQLWREKMAERRAARGPRAPRHGMLLMFTSAWIGALLNQNIYLAPLFRISSFDT